MNTARRAAWARLMVTAALALVTAAAVQRAGDDDDAALPVRFAEGSLHGFLELRTAAGGYLASGDLLQRLRGNILESRMVFHFADSSYFEEAVDFTQRGVFSLIRYRLVQRGPAFERDLDARLERNGRYTVKSRKRGEAEERDEGTLELPPDIANGMVIVLLKNLPAGRAEQVHVVAFTPKPRLIGLELAPEGQDDVAMGRRTVSTRRYVFKPKLGTLLGIAARVTGQFPPDSYAWIVTDDAPAFVRFQGPLYDGPAWRIDLVGPQWERPPVIPPPQPNPRGR